MVNWLPMPCGIDWLELPDDLRIDVQMAGEEQPRLNVPKNTVEWLGAFSYRNATPHRPLTTSTTS